MPWSTPQRITKGQDCEVIVESTSTTGSIVSSSSKSLSQHGECAVAIAPSCAVAPPADLVQQPPPSAKAGNIESGARAGVAPAPAPPPTSDHAVRKPARWPAPPSKSYLPAFVAPEAHGRKWERIETVSMAISALRNGQTSAEAEAGLKGPAAKRAKAAKRRKTSDSRGSDQRGSPKRRDHDEERASGCELLLIIAASVAIAVFEALDIDVLAGLLLWPVRRGARTEKLVLCMEVLLRRGRWRRRR